MKSKIELLFTGTSILIGLCILALACSSGGVKTSLVIPINGDNDDETDVIREGSGEIVLRTELQYYPVGVETILVFWENRSDDEVMFGEPFWLEKYDSTRRQWMTVQMNEDGFFILPGYMLYSGLSRKHLYHLGAFYPILGVGKYRICTDYSDFWGRYYIRGEFTITDDVKLLEKSELDHDKLKGYRRVGFFYSNAIPFMVTEIGDEVPVHIYKNNDTFDTYLVTNGTDYCELGVGRGYWGVVSTYSYSAGKNEKYVLYSYSRIVDGRRMAYVCVFDVMRKEEVFRKEFRTEFDVVINQQEDHPVFMLFLAAHIEYSGGGFSSISIYDDTEKEYLGSIIYENGRFSYHKK